jgi:hypothetical protein
MPLSDIDIPTLIKEMTDAAKKVLKSNWKELKPFAEQQLKNLAENIKLIAVLKAKGKIDEEKAKLHLAIQKESARTVFLTIEGIGILTAENAINAALKVIQTTVNKSIGWALI